ncbi:MAG: hypothetical protein HWN79_08520 [Candidatus Lokiarchaeota archaeon]|nr:hypothetical protein [Candidatus Lokiarchaeota archaeon]
MSIQYTPKKIYSKVLNKEIEKKDAIKLFESLIHNSDNEEIRCTALDYIGKIAFDDKKTFDVIEYCLISDESPFVRYEAAKTLIQAFPKRENTPLIWAIQNENSVYFFKKLIDLLETYNTSQFKNIREEALTKIEHHYNLNSNDSKFILDIDYLDYMKFKTEFSNFSRKFELLYEAKHLLIKENTEFGYKGLGRVQTSKNGYILNLALIDLVEIPDSICNLTKLESLEISYCNLKDIPNTCPNLLSLKNLILSNNQFHNLPRWVIEIANKNKYVDKYVNSGVLKSEAHTLGLLEIVTGRACKKMQRDKTFGPKGTVRYEVNNDGYITKILYISTESRIGVFPEVLCSLEFLEELTLIDQNIQFIPETIERLKRLKLLDLRHNKIEILPESMKELINLEFLY